MVNAPKILTTSLGCLGALLTVVIAFSAFFTATEQAQLTGERIEGECVEAVVFSPDGKTLYGTGSIHSPALYSSTLQAWDVQTGKLLWRHLQEEYSTSSHISLSHDGKTLLLPVGLRLYDARTGQRKRPYLSEAPTLSTYCPALFTQDDKEIIAVAGDGSAPVVLDATTGKLKRKLQTARKFRIENIALSPDGKQLAFQQDNQLVLRDLATDKTLTKQTVEETYHITPFYFLPDGKCLQYGGKVLTFGKPELTTASSIVPPDAISLDSRRSVILEERCGKNQRHPLGTIKTQDGKHVTLEGKTGW